MDSGGYTITITVTDGDDETDQTGFTLSVYNFNDAPPSGPSDWPNQSFSGGDYSLNHAATRDYDGYVVDSQSQGNLTCELVDGPAGASMSSDGVLTWSIPTPPSSGPIDARWYNAYKFLLKFTDDGTGGGGSRNQTVAIFQSPEVNVDLTGAAGNPPNAIKKTPIAVDDFLVTPVETELVANVIGENYNPSLRGGDYLGNGASGATFEKLSDPQHAASFDFDEDTGEFTYVPQEDFEGLDTFTYRIDDAQSWSEYDPGTQITTYAAHNYSNVATVTIQVGKGARAYLDAEGLVDDLLLLAVSNDYIDANNNGVYDLEEQAGPMSGEVDLVPVDLSYWLRSDAYQSDFKVSLATGYKNMVRLWYDPERTHELTPSIPIEEQVGEEWLLDEMPDTVWIEAVAPGQTWLTLQIGGKDTSMFTNMVYAGAQTPADSHTINIVNAVFDLSVDNDNLLGGPIDLARRYLPGYEGDVPKVSTGTTFNAPSYVGQHMQLVLDKAGADIGVTRVEFKIDFTTKWSGFAENATAPAVEGDTKNDDFSFNVQANLRQADATIGTDRSWGSIWCKDYGGEAWITANAYKDQTLLRSFFLRVPLDNDLDGMADKWEIQKVKDWNAQFATSLPTTLPAVLEYVTSEEDAERRDPDGPNTDGGTDMNAHAAPGDGRTAFQEYRGYILDGGGFDWDGNNGHPGGHVRLNPAYKELLVEVDAMANVANMPDRNGIQYWMDLVALGASQKTDGAGIRLFYVIQNMLTPYSDFAGTEEASPDELWWNYCLSQRHALLKSFTHFQFADKLGNDPLDLHFVGSDFAGQGGVIGGDRMAGVFLSTVITFAGYAQTDVTTFVRSAISHELLHTLTFGKGDEDAGGHFADTNGNGTKGEADDSERLLYDRFYPVASTTLAAGIDAAVTTIPLTSTVGVPTSGVAYIFPQAGGPGAEDVLYSGITGNSLTVTARGAYGSGAKAHAVPSLVGFFRGDLWVEFRQLRYGLGTTKFITVR